MTLVDLVVGLHVPGCAPVHHTAHVRLVDAHAKGDGGHHHLHLVIQERLVGAAPLLLGEAGMIHSAVYAVAGQLVVDPLHILPAGAVHDGRTVELSPLPRDL